VTIRFYLEYSYQEPGKNPHPAIHSLLSQIVDRFREAGFLGSDVPVLLPENLGPKELATEKSNKAPEGA
jgi:hypothetical protein